MADYNEQELQNMPMEELRDMVTLRLKSLSRRSPEAPSTPAPAAMPAQTATPPAPIAEDTAPAGMEAEREDSGMADNPFSPESRLAAARSAIGRQRRIRENLPKDVY